MYKSRNEEINKDYQIRKENETHEDKEQNTDSNRKNEANLVLKENEKYQLRDDNVTKVNKERNMESNTNKENENNTNLDRNEEKDEEKDEEKSYRKNNYLTYNILNIQSLTQAKMIEVEEIVNEENVFLLTETHKRDGRIRNANGLGIIHKTRKRESKKGGGIMAVWKEDEDTEIKQLKCKSEDMLIIEVNKAKEKHIIVTVYLSVNDTEKNKEMIKEIISTTEKYKEEKLIIMGDLNAHIGLVGSQSVNQNGRLVRDLMEHTNLIMLNLDEEKTTGEITWSQGNMESVIDFVLCNEKNV